MTIEFRLHITFPNIRQQIKEFICRHRGHVWEKYEEKDFWSIGIVYDLDKWYGKIDKKCRRCGDYHRGKPKTTGEKIKIPMIKSLKKKKK